MLAVHQKLFDDVKQSATDILKTAFKTVIQKTVEATVDLIGNKTANEITRIHHTTRLVQKQK